MSRYIAIAHRFFVQEQTAPLSPKLATAALPAVPSVKTLDREPKKLAVASRGL